MIEYIYQVDIDCKNMTMLELYDIVNLAEMYDMPDLMDELKTQLKNIPLTMDNLMNVAHTAAQLNQFKVVSSAVLLTCSKFLKKSMNTKSNMELLQFAANQFCGSRKKTALHLLDLVKDLPPVCPNCDEDEDACLVGKPVTHDKLNAGMNIRVNRLSDYWGRGRDGGQWALSEYSVVSLVGTDEVEVRESGGEMDVSKSAFDGEPTFLYNCYVD